MDWNNIDLTSGYERDQTFLNGYSFDTLILELTCNYPREEITPELVIKFVKEEIQKKTEEAISIVENNAKNIAEEVVNYHKQD